MTHVREVFTGSVGGFNDSRCKRETWKTEPRVGIPTLEVEGMRGRERETGNRAVSSF